MKALPENTTCSAALGSRFRIACAALLFFVVIAAAKGVNPALSLRVRSSPGWASKREIITACWFSIAIWIGVFPSASYKTSPRWKLWFVRDSLASEIGTMCALLEKLLFRNHRTSWIVYLGVNIGIIFHQTLDNKLKAPGTGKVKRGAPIPWKHKNNIEKIIKRF